MARRSSVDLLIPFLPRCKPFFCSHAGAAFHQIPRHPYQTQVCRCWVSSEEWRLSWRKLFSPRKIPWCLADCLLLYPSPTREQFPTHLIVVSPTISCCVAGCWLL